MTNRVAFCYHFTMDSFTALRWQWEMGATDFVGNQPANWSRAKPMLPVQTVQAAQPLLPDRYASEALPMLPSLVGPDLSVVTTLDSLRAAIAAFDGFEIKKSAKQMVFGEGCRKSTCGVCGRSTGCG